MFLCDYHLHSDCSVDGDDSISKLAEVLCQKGFDEFAVTDHLDVNRNYTMGNFRDFYNPERYFSELLKARELYPIQIKAGIEIGQPYHQIDICRAVMDQFTYDFVILSLHTTQKYGDISKVDYREIPAHAVMLKYFSELYDSLDFKDFDVLGHLDFPKRYMLRSGVDIDMNDYMDEQRQILKKTLSMGKGIELNLSGIRKGLGYYHPIMPVLKLYRELGGEIITVGEDGHRISEAGCNIEDGYEILRQAGFFYFCTFTNRKPEFHKLS